VTHNAADAFSLAEVVIALGVIAIATTAILAVFPVALTTGHSAQDATRAPEIAQSIIASLAAQAMNAQGNLNTAATIPPATTPVDLTSSTQYITYADNDGQLTDSASNAAYKITIFTNNSPPGFPTPPPAYANQVTVRVAAPAIAPAANQTYRDYVRIISKY